MLIKIESIRCPDVTGLVSGCLRNCRPDTPEYAVIDSKKLPSYLSSDLDAVRNIGNFSAHPIKSKRTGEIIEVEPGEAEWNLNILEQLFDFYLVQPEISRKKRENLNKKLKDAGKPQMK